MHAVHVFPLQALQYALEHVGSDFDPKTTEDHQIFPFGFFRNHNFEISETNEYGSS